ncbi:MAG: TolC family protein [Cyanobacteria bacterium SIG26]|nr:TolC family protein [Cyanobacteria bacterium SIG26]
MKKLLCLVLSSFMLFCYSGLTTALAIQESPQAKALQAAPNARSVELAFVFDGPSDKNKEVLTTFQKTITKSLLPDYKAVFPTDLVFTGDWTEQGAKTASDKALKSRALTVVSLGYMSSEYLVSLQNKNKFVITIGEYGLRDMGSAAFFNPVKQYVNDFILYKKLVPTQHKTAILMNENYYKTQKDWNSIITKKFKEKDCDLDFVVVPVSSKNVDSALKSIPADVDSVFVTPLFNLTTEQRKGIYTYLTNKKLPTFSSLGKEDVQLGAMLGTSTPDVDRKLAEATSFSIHGVLHGNTVKTEKIAFFDDKVIFYNKDTGAAVGYAVPLRLLNNCQIISSKPLPKYDLSYVFNTMEESNLDIQRKRYLVQAARRSTTAAYLKYLPTLRIDLGHQNYNGAYAQSYTDVPARVGQFVIGMDQMIYAPDLVTNIIVKHKKLKFDKAEKVLTEQNMGLHLGFLYMETLMLENMIKVQEEQLAETRENLAISRVRQQTGVCGKEEVLRWAGQVSEEEKKLLNMKADYNNIRITINKLLYKDQKEMYTFAPLVATDPAFFTSEMHVIDHVRTPEKLAKFTDMLVEEVKYLSPETTKLRAAIAMKKAEIGNYAQKFVLPNAKLSLEYGSQFDRQLPYEQIGHMGLMAAGIPYIGLDRHSTRVMIAAQWKPIEGGTKIAEIARCKAELNELNAYLEQVHTELEMNVREVVNRAIAKYFIIEKSYKAMFAEAENYQLVKAKYLRGQAPITQVADAQHLYLAAKLAALNSQYDFFKELIWVQRGLVSVNWTKASDPAKKFLDKIRQELPADPTDFAL